MNNRVFTHGVMSNIILVLFITFFIWQSPNIGECYTLAAWWWLPMGVLIMSMVSESTHPSRLSVSKVLSERWLVRLGDISFDFYMLHGLIISFTVVLFSHIIPEASSWLLLVSAFLLSLAGAMICSRYFEKK